MSRTGYPISARFERDLIDKIDVETVARGCSRSEFLRDAAQSELRYSTVRREDAAKRAARGVVSLDPTVGVVEGASLR